MRQRTGGYHGSINWHWFPIRGTFDFPPKLEEETEFVLVDLVFLMSYTRTVRWQTLKVQRFGRLLPASFCIYYAFC